LREGYFYLVASHRHRADLIDEYPRMFRWNTIEFALNDISAMGAIRALRQIGWQVPEDISVVGFDDIQSAAYQNPSLTTVHQPLREMGRAAAEILLKRINRPGSELHDRYVVEPELVIRETTARAAGSRNRPRDCHQIGGRVNSSL
jgi:LacI family transcriptional regulator